MNAIILAHGKAADTVARHLANWSTAFDSYTIICPADDPLPNAFPIGESCRNGRGCIERLTFAICMASRYAMAAIFEYDTLIFKNLKSGEGKDWNLYWKMAEKKMLLCSEVFKNEDPEWLFGAPEYGHGPWIARQSIWWELLTTGSDSQHGFPDRWLANAAKRSGIVLAGMEGAYSRDTAFDAKAARLARLKGAPCIHGVKTKEEYEEIMQSEPSGRTSCAACGGSGCEQCIPDEFTLPGQLHDEEPDK